jgi:catechol 2,3-dioxygenase-like lactoylglutathione lyase family enzyme
MSLHRLTSITIGVPDVAAASAFYSAFGLTEHAPGRFSTLRGGDQLELVPASRRRLVRLGLGVDDPDDLGRIAARLCQLDVSAKPERGVLRVIEPTTKLEVVAQVAPRIAAPAEPAMALNGPGRIERRDARSPAVDAPQPVRPRKLGHVVIGSSDALATRRFFVEGFGFQVSDEIAGLKAAFMRCSTDHHNLLVQPAPVDFLHHTAWEVADVDEIGRGASQLIAGGAERHVWGLGRHAIGSNYFWYLRDPAGNFVEYYSDLDVIEHEEAWRAQAGGGAHGLAAWAPPVPGAFLAPEDIVALMALRGDGSARRS